VKITVIATGFQPENAPVAERPSAKEPRIVVPTASAEPARPVEVIHEPPPEPEPMVEEPSAPHEAAAAAAGAGALAFDPDDLDTPAYLRRGKLVN